MLLMITICTLYGALDPEIYFTKINRIDVFHVLSPICFMRKQLKTAAAYMGRDVLMLLKAREVSWL